MGAHVRVTLLAFGDSGLGALEGLDRGGQALGFIVIGLGLRPGFVVWVLGCRVYRGTSLISNCNLLGPYSRTVPRVLWWPWGGVLFLMSEVPLYAGAHAVKHLAVGFGFVF